MEKRTVTFEATITFTIDYDEAQAGMNDPILPTSALAARRRASGILDAMIASTYPESVVHGPRYGNPKVTTARLEEQK